ncbi:MAG: hypothetical protein AAGJ89_09955, partial [Pseudomonadota bacterium]
MNNVVNHLRHILFSGALALVSLPANSSEIGKCIDQVPCELGARSYHVKEPDEWNGKTPLPGRPGNTAVLHDKRALPLPAVEMEK